MLFYHTIIYNNINVLMETVLQIKLEAVTGKFNLIYKCSTNLHNTIKLIALVILNALNPSV